MPTRLQARSSMGLCSCDIADVEDGIIALERARSAPAPELLGLPAQALFEVVDKCQPTTTAREFVKNHVLPQTKGQGCSYAQLAQLGDGAPLGHPTYYVVLSWDVPLAPALRAILQHVKLQQEAGSSGGGSTTVGARTAEAVRQAQQQPRGLSSGSNCGGVPFIFLDFLCIDLWGSSPGGAVVPEQQPVLTISAAAPHRRPRKSSTRRLLRGAGSHRSISRMSSCPDLNTKSSALEHTDVEMFIGSITAMLLSSRAVGTTLLLYLDPDMLVLGSLLPMHAAWRGMHAGLQLQVTCSPELPWPQQHAIPANMVFAFHEAEESDVFLRDAILCDIHDTMHSITSGSSLGSPAPSVSGEGLHRYNQQLLTEEQALWRYLLRSVLLDDKRAGSGDVLIRQEFIRATFLSLDCQYKSAKAKLQEVLKLLAQQPLQQPLDTVPVLCMLTHVLLQLGTLVDAHKYAVQALEACKVSNSLLTMNQLQARAWHTLVLEALQQGNQAEQDWRNTYIQLDQQLGPRHTLTLHFMGHLGRLLSRTRGRQEEGAMLLTECLKGTTRLTSGQPQPVSATGCFTLPYQPKQPPTQLQHNVGVRQLRLATARLSMDLAIVLRQLAVSAPANDASPLFGCPCTDQIVAAFQNMDEPVGGGACMLPSGAKSESDSLWAEALRLVETCCGPQHDASCLSRAQCAAEKGQPGVLHKAAGGFSPPRNGDASPTSPPVVTASPQAELQAKEMLQALKAEVFLLRQAHGTAHNACTLQGHLLLAHTLDAAGLVPEAEAAWRLVVDGHRQLLGNDSVHLARALVGLAGCLARQGKLAEAAEHCAAAASTTAIATGALSMQTGMALMAEADMHRAGKDLSSAESALIRAVDVYRHCYGMTNWRTKQVYAAQAEVMEAQGHAQQAADLRTKYKIKLFV